MAVRLGDLLLTPLAGKGGRAAEEGVGSDKLDELRNMVQQASARLDAISLEAKLRPRSTSEIDHLKSKIKASQEILAGQRQKLTAQGAKVVGTVPSAVTTYRVGELVLTVIPNSIVSGEDLPPGGPPDPPGTPGPSGWSYLDVGDPYVQLEVDTITALLGQAYLGITGASVITAGLPNSVAEVEALQTKLAGAQETLDEMRMLSNR